MARAAANSYGTGEKYAGINSEGKNEFVREDGSRYTVDDGTFTSPSGKTSEISDGGRTTTTLSSSDERQVGNTYRDGELVSGYGGKGAQQRAYDDVVALANQMAGNTGGMYRRDIDPYILRAMSELGYTGSLEDFLGDIDLYRAQEAPAQDESLEKAAADAARASYISRMMKDRTGEQDAAYTGSNRDLREFMYR